MLAHVEHAITITLLVLGGLQALAHGAAKAADIYVGWALGNGDPSDDARARSLQRLTGKTLAALDWLADNLPAVFALRRGVRR
jgi:hypothetical protein